MGVDSQMIKGVLTAIALSMVLFTTIHKSPFTETVLCSKSKRHSRPAVDGPHLYQLMKFNTDSQVLVNVCMRERGRERERDTHTHTHRQRQRQRKCMCVRETM